MSPLVESSLRKFGRGLFAVRWSISLHSEQERAMLHRAGAQLCYRPGK
jgi:hypothetical protein